MLMSIKTLTFYSNYYNHHQKALCDALEKILGDGFTFVATMPMESFRTKMGWGEEEPSYVLHTYESRENYEKGLKLGLESDLVLMGTAPEEFIERRLSENKIVFRYSERPLKEGFIKFFIPRLTGKYLHLHVRNRKKPIYVLGASAFTASDYKKMFGSYPGKCFNFGYFPEHYEYDYDKLSEEKRILSGGKPSILWMGRMLKLKHPELCVEAARILKSKGYDFNLKMIGEGEMLPKLCRLVDEYDLKETVSFENFLKPKEARLAMADAQIYLMTSNKLEGWGSVIYEALNAGCAVIASHVCGATPTLITHEENGLIFKSGSAKSLARQLEKLLADSSLVTKYGRNAYEKMHTFWNPAKAAENMLILYEYIYEAINENNEEMIKKAYSVRSPIAEGPCSDAPYLKNNWYHER